MASIGFVSKKRLRRARRNVPSGFVLHFAILMGHFGAFWGVLGNSGVWRARPDGPSRRLGLGDSNTGDVTLASHERTVLHLQAWYCAEMIIFAQRAQPAHRFTRKTKENFLKSA